MLPPPHLYYHITEGLFIAAPLTLYMMSSCQQKLQIILKGKDSLKRLNEHQNHNQIQQRLCSCQEFFKNYDYCAKGFNGKSRQHEITDG